MATPETYSVAEGFKVYKVDDYVAKPLTFEDLRAILQKHLG